MVGGSCWLKASMIDEEGYRPCSTVMVAEKC